MKKISLFTPCYNEEGNVYKLYNKVTEVMKSLPQYEYEYIFSDNCSTDDTPNILRKIASEDKRVKVIFNMRNFGPSRSGAHGFFQTSGDASICLACDLQDPPELIPEFIKKWEEGYKVVLGQKKGTDESKIMSLCRKTYYKLIKAISDTPQYEDITGYGLYDKEVVELLKSCNDPTPRFSNLIGEYGYDVAMIQFYKPSRNSGKSSYNFVRYFNEALHSIVTTSDVPIKSSFWACLIFAILGTVEFFKKRKMMPNNRHNIAFLYYGIAGLFMYVGFIGSYIYNNYKILESHPLVIEKERINF